ncbi:uncharacterized protein BROUX77_005222 [Berkeleyomyces rouxiae]|uniref:uncharacterized protein n=1 Tax=Berkeleyomyces rouxiae TaxID=2035830 RepID=UPI003B8025F2
MDMPRQPAIEVFARRTASISSRPEILTEYPISPMMPSASMPSNLGEIREKVVLLQDFPTSTPGRFGVPWKSGSMDVLEGKLVLFDAGLSLKWSHVESHIEASSKQAGNKLFITYTSVRVGHTPIDAAGGKQDKKDGMNDRLGKYLSEGKISKTGIISMDFPGKDLVNQIIKLNDFQ